MRAINQTLSFLKYFLNARLPAHTHSPYLFELLRFMFDQGRKYYVFESIEAERKGLFLDHAQVPGPDPGAGSRTGNGQRRISDLAKTSLSSPAKCAAYFRLTTFHQPQNVIEVGTSLGISTAYIAAAHRTARIVGLEGSEAVLKCAQRVHQALGLDNVNFICGNFDQTLASSLAEIGVFDLAFLDGNHRLEPTLEYFQMLKGHAHNSSILVVDDIRWSPEMWRAWSQIKEDVEVTAAVDVFSFGMLFFRKEFKDKVDLQILPSRRLREMIL